MALGRIWLEGKLVSVVLGSGRVTFNNQRSYLKAVSAAFVEIKTTKFTKKVSVLAYVLTLGYPRRDLGQLGQVWDWGHNPAAELT